MAADRSGLRVRLAEPTVSQAVRRREAKSAFETTELWLYLAAVAGVLITSQLVGTNHNHSDECADHTGTEGLPRSDRVRAGDHESAESTDDKAGQDQAQDVSEDIHLRAAPSLWEIVLGGGPGLIEGGGTAR